MTNYAEKMNNWIEKVNLGKAGMEMIWWKNNQEKGTWAYRAENYCRPIIALTVLIWDENKHYLSYEWNADSSCNDDGFIIIIKDQKKVLLFNGKDIFDFGMEKETLNKMNFLLLYHCDSIGSIVAASTDNVGVMVELYSLNEKDDILQNVLRKIINKDGNEKDREGGDMRGSTNEQKTTETVAEGEYNKHKIL